MPTNTLKQDFDRGEPFQGVSKDEKGGILLDMAGGIYGIGVRSESVPMPSSFGTMISRCPTQGEEGFRERQTFHMLSILSHDMRGDLVAMGAVLRLVLRGTYGDISEGVHRELDGLVSRIRGSIGLLEDFLGATLASEGNPEREQDPLHLDRDVL